MGELYRIKQTGFMMVMVIGLIVLVEAGVIGFLVYTGVPTTVFLLLLAMLIPAYVFSSLTVVVTMNAVRLWFGLGVCTKSYSLCDLVAVRRVKNPWYYGWGIRRVDSGTWLFSVSGLDAVELHLKDGTFRRIGTDRPEELEKEIERALSGWIR